MSLLRAENLTKSYNRVAVVRSLSLEVQEGEIVGLLGRNGAGKTTVFQLVTGLVKPDSGKIFLNETDISRMTTSERAEEGIGYLPQECSVFLKASVEDNLRIILELLPYSRAERRTVAKNRLEEIGLAPLARQEAHTLSGGERRRLEFCRALLLEPKVLLLDEPFAGIDPRTIEDLQGIIQRLSEHGTACMISDHNVRDTFQIADRAYIIDAGKVLVEGTPEDVAADKVARERFLGESFHIGEEVPSTPLS